MRRTLFTLVLAGCFGEGPVPGAAPDAPIVFAAPIPSGDQICTNSTYITAVAFGSATGYAVLYPYGPETGECNESITAPVPVMAFPIDGSMPAGQQVGSAGMSSQQLPPPHITLGANGPLWVFDQPGQPAITSVAEPGSTPGVITNGSGGQSLGYLIGVAGDTVATSGGLQASDPMDPNYPCCTDNGGGQVPAGQLTQFSISGSQVTAGTPQQVPSIAIGELASSIAASSTTLFYVLPQQPTFAIEAVTGSATTIVATLDVDQPVPVGLVADDAHLAWAFAQDAQQTPLQPGCSIWVTGSGSGSDGTIEKIFSSSNISCMGLAIDPDALYFAIVDERELNGTPYLHGLGVGRVDFAMHDFSSIAFDIGPAASGPRRVMTAQSDPADLFVLDPLAIARIAKTSFGGRQDIAP
ncbi:MAG TPA: hypothetical protein VH143_27410 [Kofleriaceae bacterium]|nr:hypothetical protein [Kofleriaceae bacterium]